VAGSAAEDWVQQAPEHNVAVVASRSPQSGDKAPHSKTPLDLQPTASEPKAAKPMRLADILHPKLVIPQLRSRNKWDAIEELVDKLVEAHELRILDRRQVLEAVLQRERSRSTGLDGGLALPHARTPVVEDMIGSLGIAPDGIPFESTDGSDSQLVCLLVVPELQHRDHIKTVADAARLLSGRSLRDELIAAGRDGSAERILEIIRQAEGPGCLDEWETEEGKVRSAK